MHKLLQRALLVAGLWLAAGCSVDVKDGIGPLLPVPNVAGQALRAGAPAGGLDAELRDAETAETVGSTVTQGGRFEFADIPPGHWEIKVSGDDPGDFDSVSRTLLLANADSLYELPDFEVWAYGCAVLEPQDGSSLPRPNLFAPLTFRWTLPSGSNRELDWVRAYLYTAAGDQVWTSDRILAAEVAWNGIGNEGDFAGLPVAAGAYYWRLKLAFTDSLEARLDPTELEFQ